MNRVISIRGRSGSVLGLLPAVDESSEEIWRCIKDSLPEEGICQVEHVATDAPSQKLHAQLAAVLPQFQGLSLDPTHAAMRYEQATNGRKTAGSMLLRRFMVKFTGHDASMVGDVWGAMFDGAGQHDLSPQEAKLREQILTTSMSRRRAARVIQDAGDLEVWPTRIQFIEAIAALASQHSADMARKIEGTKISVAKVLHGLTSPDKMEWLFNSLRYRHTLPLQVRLLLPSGTASNEALHAELNGWFRQIQSMHRSTLCLKLDILRLGKLLSHNTSLYSPTARQMPQSHVLARRLGTPVWDRAAWESWVVEQRKSGRTSRSDMPLAKRRQSERDAVHQTNLKRPAATTFKRPASQRRKRTAFTMQRGARIKRTGVHLRRPAKTKIR